MKEHRGGNSSNDNPSRKISFQDPAIITFKNNIMSSDYESLKNGQNNQSLVLRVVSEAQDPEAEELFENEDGIKVPLVSDQKSNF